MSIPKLSKNPMKNYLLQSIWPYVEDLAREGDSLSYCMKNYPNEPDYNIYQSGSALVYIDDIEQLYIDAGYAKPPKGDKAEMSYMRFCGECARLYKDWRKYGKNGLR